MNELKCPKCGTSFKVDENEYDSILKQVRDSEFEKQIAARELQFKTEKENAIKLAESETEKRLLEKLNGKDTEIVNLKNEIKIQEDKKESDIKTIKTETENTYKDEISKLRLNISELENQIKNEQIKKESDIKTIKTETENSYKDEISELKLTITKLEDEIKLKETEKKQELQEIVSSKEQDIIELKNQIDLNDKEYKIKEQGLKDKYELELKSKDETIEFYKDMKAKQSTKMIGESLEQHCNYEFNRVRSIFSPNTYFEKDNDAKTGSKGDFIFRDYDENGLEIVSIMFEMKNEADETSTKHKNEDFFKELDKDRKEKNCEYAVLVSLLEIDNEIYNTGIVDVSHKYEKMYVIRPQFFIPIITLLRNASMKSLDYKKQLTIVQNQNIDISHFEENMNAFKEGFARNYRIASDKFKKAIDEIDKTIDHLQKTKDALISSENNLRLANNKAEDLTIKKLVKNNKTMALLFAEETKNDELLKYADSIEEIEESYTNKAPDEDNEKKVIKETNDNDILSIEDFFDIK